MKNYFIIFVWLWIFQTKAIQGTNQYLVKTAMKIPPLEIQKRIVKRLDEAFSRIENGTKHLQSAKDNPTKYKQSLLKSAFNGTLMQDFPLSQCESATPSLRANEMSVAIHTKEKEIDCHESLRDSRNDDSNSFNDESAYLVF